MSNNIYNILNTMKDLEAKASTKPAETKEKTKLAESMEQVLARKLAETDMDEDKLIHKGSYGNDSGDYTGKFGMPKSQKEPDDTKFDSSALADVMGSRHPYKKPGTVSHRQEHEWDDEAEEGPGDLDAALKHIPRGIKGMAEGEREANPRIPGTQNRAKSRYEPTNKPAPVKKLDKPTDKFDKIKNEGEEQVDEKAINKYAIGMAAAKKAAGYGKKPAHNLPKSVIKKGHEIAKHVKESTINMLVDNMFEDMETIMNAKSEEPLTYEQDQLKQHLGSHLYGKLVKSMKLKDEFPDDLYDNLFHFFRDEMPYGVVNRRKGDPYEWINNRLQSVFPELDEAINIPRGDSFAGQSPSGADIMNPQPKPEFEPSRIQGQRPGVLSRAAGAVGAGAKALGKALVGHNDEELAHHTRSKMTMESVYKETAQTKQLAEMMRLAGLSEVKSPKADEDYDNDGEIESEKDEVQDSRRKAAGLPFKESKADEKADKDYDNDGEVETGKEEYLGSKIAAAKKAGKLKEGEMCSTCGCEPCECDEDEEQLDECMDMVGAQQQDSQFSVNSSMDSNGNKTMTISATGEKADELAQLLRLAGQQGGEAAEPEVVAVAEPMEVGDNAENSEIAVIGDEQEVDEEKDPRYEANTTPEEHAMPTQALTKGGDGDVAGQEKKMNPTKPTWKNGDNAMSEGMSGKLMREYESIKVQK